MSREAMKLALEALVTCCEQEWRTLNNFGMKQVYDEKKVNAAIAALHAAVAEQEPVAYCTLEQLAALKLTVPSSDKIALYTAPTPRKPLTKEQIMSIDVLRYHFALNGGAGPISKKGKEIIGAIEQAHGIGEQHE